MEGYIRMYNTIYGDHNGDREEKEARSSIDR